MQPGKTPVALRRIPGADLHGTGCILASALASLLASGVPVEEAVRCSTRWVGPPGDCPPPAGRPWKGNCMSARYILLVSFPIPPTMEFFKSPLTELKTANKMKHTSKYYIFQVPVRDNREPGENPGRSRHCNR